uniref:Secreted protein n=1 Tax=Anopheles minimus TaxID=112268 RepID=A0A182WPE1_9DIPT
MRSSDGTRRDGVGLVLPTWAGTVAVLAACVTGNACPGSADQPKNQTHTQANEGQIFHSNASRRCGERLELSEAKGNWKIKK